MVARRRPRKPAAGGAPSRRILETLRLHGPKTARELTRLLGGGPVAMRVHLRNLVAAGLAAHEEERLPRGRPARRYRLTGAADALFTKQYERFALELTGALARTGGASLEEIFAGWEEDLVEYLEARLPRGEEAALAALAEHQSSFGFMASVEARPEGVSLVERNCPIASIASRFPRICDHEAAVFRRTLRRPVDLLRCQARGDPVCAFRIGPPASGGKA